jgi:hypothetical protein
MITYDELQKRKFGEMVADLEKEIDWMQQRLERLVLSEEDRAQAADLVVDLKERLQALLWSREWPVSGGIRRGADAL